MQGMIDFENWRDSLYDLPQPEMELPDEQILKHYTHNELNDTMLEYDRLGDDAVISLTFDSKDPDASLEKLIYHGDGNESMEEMMDSLLSEVTEYLDVQDSSGYFEQMHISLSDNLQRLENTYGEYTRTALLAFEGVLKETLQERHYKVWQPMESERQEWLYSGGKDADLERGCIGHLRGDFDKSTGELWTSWFDHLDKLKTSEFRKDLQDTFKDLRKEGGLLSDFATMRKLCTQEASIGDGIYGFRMENSRYEYCLRCTPRRGEYNLYLYCYDKAAEREHALAKQKTEPIKNKTKHEMER